MNTNVGKNGTGKNGTGKNGSRKNGTRNKWHRKKGSIILLGKNGTTLFAIHYIQQNL